MTNLLKEFNERCNLGSPMSYTCEQLGVIRTRGEKYNGQWVVYVTTATATIAVTAATHEQAMLRALMKLEGP